MGSETSNLQHLVHGARMTGGQHGSYAETRRRAASAGLDAKSGGDGFALRDPWGVTIELKTK